MNLFGDIANIGEDSNAIYIQYICDGQYVLGRFNKDEVILKSTGFSHLKAILEQADLYVRPGSPLYSNYRAYKINSVFNVFLRDKLSVLISRMSLVSPNMIHSKEGTLTSLSSPFDWIYDQITVKVGARRKEEGGVYELAPIKEQCFSIWNVSCGIVDSIKEEVVVFPYTDYIFKSKGKSVYQSGNEYFVSPIDASGYYCRVEKLYNKGFIVYV